MKTAIRIAALCCISLSSFASPYQPLKSPYTNTSRFPVLNWNDYQSKDTQRKQRFVRKLGVALRDYGFFALINHPVSKHTLQEAQTESQRFFALPDAEKIKYQGKITNRGYKSYQADRRDKTSDLQEYWHVGPLNPAHATPNIWPKNAPEFERSMRLAYRELDHLSKALLHPIALAMGEPHDYFATYQKHTASILRVIHYKAKTVHTEKHILHKAPHKDPNVLTLITGVKTKGLYIERPCGAWMEVPIIQNAIIVSASNMLEHISNGYFKSTKHKVDIDGYHDRFSMPFFVHFDPEAMLHVSKQAIKKTGGIATYHPIAVKDALAGHNWFEVPEKSNQ